MTISTHVLDAAQGAPARDMSIVLEHQDGVSWQRIGHGRTDEDGRCPGLTDGAEIPPGVYRLRFDTGGYFARAGTPTFYPLVELTFGVTDASAHYHVPLLLSPFAYSTYRGS